MRLFKQSATLRLLSLTLLVLLLSLVTLITQSRAEVAVPPLTNYVVDTTNTLTHSQLEELNQQIAQLQEEKGSQIMVLMVPTVEPDDTVETFARRVFDEWRIGRVNIDDGVLVLVAKDDRRMRIETGYGLEGAITDVQASYIINQDMAPAFRSDNYFGGVKKAVDQLSLLIQGEELPDVDRSGSSTSSNALPYEFLLFFAAFILFWPIWLAPIVGGLFVLVVTGSISFAGLAAVLSLVWSLVFKKILGPGVLAANNDSSTNTIHRRRNNSHWGGGGGRSGGGFGGGFGGGGGGSSGGGGASGGW